MSNGKSLPAVAAILFSIAIACNNNPAGLTDPEAVAADKDAMAITYAPGDNAVSVTGNLGLPTDGANGSAITWTTDDSCWISVDGTVMRPAADSADVVVSLTATLSKGTACDVKVFVLTVRAIGYTGTVTDIDGNIYSTVKIGDQVWTVENLRTTRFNDGTPIPHITGDAEWENLTTPGYCFYNNTSNADTINKMGALYNWYAASSPKLAPTGWHVPDTTEWKTLVSYLIANGYNWDGTTIEDKTAKSLAAKTDWTAYTSLGAIGNDLTKNNASGFTAYPGGSRYFSGFFYDFGFYGLWWSTTEYDAANGFYRYLDYRHSYLHFDGNGDRKTCGLSVRLLKD
jgi:uncharacterized protein (TIGR02145 family)